MEMIWTTSPYWSQTTYSSSGGEGDNVSQRVQVNESGDSIASVILPQRALRLTRSNNPPLVLGAEVNRNITACGFFLCVCSVLLLSSGIALMGISVWALLGRLPYLYLTEQAAYLGVISFTLSSGMLCLPCSWFAWAAHSKKTENYIPLLSLFLCVSITMLGTGTSIGVGYRSRIVFDWSRTENETNLDLHSSSRLPKMLTDMRPMLREGIYRSALLSNLLNSQSIYETNTAFHFAWDTTQNQLHCCGITHAKDWLRVRDRVPTSCCPLIEHQKIHCTVNNAFKDGCLDVIAFELSWQTSILTGIGFIVIFIQLITLVFSSYLYLKLRPNKYQRAASQHIVHHHHHLPPPLEMTMRIQPPQTFDTQQQTRPTVNSNVDSTPMIPPNYSLYRPSRPPYSNPPPVYNGTTSDGINHNYQRQSIPKCD